MSTERVASDVPVAKSLRFDASAAVTPLFATC
jgi:hypothetical protein